MAEIDHRYNLFHKQCPHDVERDDQNTIQFYQTVSLHVHVCLQKITFYWYSIYRNSISVQFRYNFSEFVFVQKNVPWFHLQTIFLS